MGIFKSKEQKKKKMAQNKRSMSDQINLVGEGTTFEGTLHAENDVRASGRIVGTMRVDGRAIIAESGAVEGEVIATNADIAGHVQGEIHVSERLVLKSTARIDGHIKTNRLVVEEGALFTGKCEMGEDDANKASPPTSDKKSANGSPSTSKASVQKQSKGEASDTNTSS